MFKKTNELKMLEPGALLAASIAAGGQLLGGGVNAIAQSKMNKATRRWNEKMYGIQRQDAIDDWNRSNLYNAPEQQMARLKMAGLNPNLVYGTGAVANEAGPVRSTDVKGWNPQAPELPIGTAVGNGIAAFQDARLKDAVISNYEERNKNLVEDSKLKAIKQISESVNQALTNVKIAGGNIANEKAKGLLSSQLKAAQLAVDQATANIDKTKADTAFTNASNSRAAAMTAESILTSRIQRAKTQSEIDQLSLAAQNMIKDGMLKDMEIDMKRTGASWQDPLWQRRLMQLWRKYMTPKKGSILDKLQNRFTRIPD